MKKIFFAFAIIAIASSVSSCKKTYTCTCTTSGYTQVIEIPNATKAQAQTICAGDAQYQSGAQVPTCVLN